MSRTYFFFFQMSPYHSPHSMSFMVDHSQPSYVNPTDISPTEAVAASCGLTAPDPTRLHALWKENISVLRLGGKPTRKTTTTLLKRERRVACLMGWGGKDHLCQQSSCEADRKEKKTPSKKKEVLLILYIERNRERETDRNREKDDLLA